jgi:hypothetical protein
MAHRLKRHIRSNAVAYLALFVALGGTSYAAFAVPANSVTAASIRSGAVGARQLANRSINAAKLDGKTIVGHVVLVARLSGAGTVLYSKPRVTFAGGTASGFALNLSPPLPAKCPLIATVIGGTTPGTQLGTVDVVRPLNTSAHGVSIETFGPTGQSTTVAGIELVGICP